MNPEKIIELTLKACQENDDNLIEITDELKSGTMFQYLPKNVKTIINDSLFKNGVFNKIDYSLLNEEERFFIALLTCSFNSYESFKNRYYKYFLYWYYKNLNEDIIKSNINNLKFCVDYYQHTPSLFVINDDDLKEINVLKNVNLTLDSDYLKYISKLIEIGKCIQFNVSGFIKNELIYLICGCCVCYCLSIKNKIKSFEELVMIIQTFIQLNIQSISIDGRKFENYGLSTALSFNTKEGFKDNEIKEQNFNYRYKCAYEYYKERKAILVNGIEPNKRQFDKTQITEIVQDEQGIRLNTSLKKEDLNEVWEYFEILFDEYNKNKTNENLERILIRWFDSQCLTRSTCLTGVLLLMILSEKKIELTKNELIDWKAIICNKIDNTYSFKDDIELSDDEKKDFEKMKLKDVLTLTKFYIKVIMEH